MMKLITDFVSEHQIWMIPIVFIFAFGESLAFISLMLPATIILLGLGALMGKSGIPFLPIYLVATLGAFLGDWLSYWIGARYKATIRTVWPLSRYPHLLKRGQTFFERWGVFGAFLGRFCGPLRAVVPLIAGICGMSQYSFQLANLASAFIWAFGVLAPGALGIQWLSDWMG